VFKKKKKVESNNDSIPKVVVKKEFTTEVFMEGLLSTIFSKDEYKKSDTKEILLPGFTVEMNGKQKKMQPVRYTPDFEINPVTPTEFVGVMINRRTLIEVKTFFTQKQPDYRLRKRLVIDIGISRGRYDFIEIMLSGSGKNYMVKDVHIYRYVDVVN
jgi:hypothetical protein